MADEYIPFERLSDATKLKIVDAALKRRKPGLQDLVNAVKNLMIEVCKKTIAVTVDGKLTEVKSMNNILKQ